MKVWLALVLVLGVLLPECSAWETEPDVPTTSGNTGITGPVFVDSTEILYLESFPVQARLVVRGSLPTPCHEARWEVEDSGWGIEVTLWSEILLGQDCAQVLEPFEASIPLGSFEFSNSSVLLNGEEIGRLVIGTKPIPRFGSLTGAGWSFGMCGGYCKADLVIDGEALVLTGGGWIGDQPLYVNRGVFTPVGIERVGEMLARLGSKPLDLVYGCPDCADGGAAYLEFDRQGATSRHEMEFSRPPKVLAELHGLALAVIEALETCESGELVTVAKDCERWRGL